MMDEFTVELRAQREWNWLIVIAFFLGGISGGLFLISTYLDFTLGLHAAILLVTLGTCPALFFDLGRPERFLRLFSQIGSSWISRGTLLISAFVAFGVLYVLHLSGWFAWLPWSVGTWPGQTIRAIAFIAAFGVMIYTGFVMSYSPSIPFWNTTLLPVMFVVYALMGGTAAVFSIAWITPDAARIAGIMEPVEIFLILATIVLLFSYLATMSSSTVAARESVRLLVAGRLSWPFWGGVVVVGLLAPLALAGYIYWSGVGITVASGALAVTGVLELSGGFVFRYSLLKAGVYVPVI